MKRALVLAAAGVAGWVLAVVAIAVEACRRAEQERATS